MIHNPDTQSRPGKQIPVDLAQPLVLTVHSPDGDVAIRAVDRSDVLIDYGADDDSEALGDAGALVTIETHDNRIEVRPNPHVDVGWSGLPGDLDLETVVGQITRAIRTAGPFFSTKPGKARIGAGHVDWPDIAIEVPRSIAGRVEVHTASGDVQVDGLAGEIALRTMSGDVRAVRTAGSLALQVANGDLLVEEMTGRLTAHTVSGDVRVTSAQLDGFELQTVNGDIRVEAVLTGDGPFRAKTTSGDVALTLRRPAPAGEEPAATLAFHTIAGDAHVAPPLRRVDRRRWQSGAGERGPHIDITTVSGDLNAEIAAMAPVFTPPSGPTIEATDMPPAPPAAAPVASFPRESELAGAAAASETTATTASSAARLAVLEAVERGEIDVEEALRRLDMADPNVNP